MEMENNLRNHEFTLYAPYVAIPQISIISREMAEAMHMSEAERAAVTRQREVTLAQPRHFGFQNLICENVDNVVFS